MNTPEEPIPTKVACRKCGYNLTGVTIGARCPECGEPAIPVLPSDILPTNALALSSMLTGILSIPFVISSCMCMGFGSIPGMICATLSLILAHYGAKQIKTGVYTDSSKTMILVGRICGGIGLGIGLLTFGAVALFIFKAIWDSM